MLNGGEDLDTFQQQFLVLNEKVKNVFESSSRETQMVQKEEEDLLLKIYSTEREIDDLKKSNVELQMERDTVKQELQEARNFSAETRKKAFEIKNHSVRKAKNAKLACLEKTATFESQRAAKCDRQRSFLHKLESLEARVEKLESMEANLDSDTSIEIESLKQKCAEIERLNMEEKENFEIEFDRLNGLEIQITEQALMERSSLDVEIENLSKHDEAPDMMDVEMIQPSDVVVIDLDDDSIISSVKSSIEEEKKLCETLKKKNLELVKENESKWKEHEVYRKETLGTLEKTIESLKADIHEATVKKDRRESSDLLVKEMREKITTLKVEKQQLEKAVRCKNKENMKEVSIVSQPTMTTKSPPATVAKSPRVAKSQAVAKSPVSPKSPCYANFNVPKTPKVSAVSILSKTPKEPQIPKKRVFFQDSLPLLKRLQESTKSTETKKPILAPKKKSTSKMRKLFDYGEEGDKSISWLYEFE